MANKRYNLNKICTWAGCMESKREDDVLEMTNEEYRVSSPDYGELIIEMVSNIKKKSYLKMAYGFIEGLYETEKAES